MKRIFFGLFFAATAPASAADPYLSGEYPKQAVLTLVVETESGSILIKPSDGPTRFDISPEPLPGDMCRLEKKLSGSTLRLTARSAAEITAKTGSGDIRANGLSGLLNAKSGSGGISAEWEKTPPSGTISADTGSGDIAARFPKDARVRTSLRSGSGATRSDFHDEKSALALSARSGSGSISVERKH